MQRGAQRPGQKRNRRNSSESDGDASGGSRRVQVPAACAPNDRRRNEIRFGFFSCAPSRSRARRRGGQRQRRDERDAANTAAGAGPGSDPGGTRRGQVRRANAKRAPRALFERKKNATPAQLVDHGPTRVRARKRTLRTRLATIIVPPRSAVFAQLAEMKTKMAEKDAKMAEMEKELLAATSQIAQLKVADSTDPSEVRLRGRRRGCCAVSERCARCDRKRRNTASMMMERRRL